MALLYLLRLRIVYRLILLIYLAFVFSFLSNVCLHFTIYKFKKQVILKITYFYFSMFFISWLQRFQLWILTYYQMQSFCHGKACWILELVLRDTMYSIAPAAKLRHMAIISSDIEPTRAPKKAPIPVVIPDKIT